MRYNVVLYWGGMGAPITEDTLYESHTVEADNITSGKLMKVAKKMLLDRGVHMEPYYRVMETIPGSRLDIDYGSHSTFIAIIAGPKN